MTAASHDPSALPTDAELNAIGVLKRRLIEARVVADEALVGGFNPEVSFTRTQTIMGGASHCNFVYTLTRAPRSTV